MVLEGLKDTKECMRGPLIFTLTTCSPQVEIPGTDYSAFSCRYLEVTEMGFACRIFMLLHGRVLHIKSDWDEKAKDCLFFLHFSIAQFLHSPVSPKRLFLFLIRHSNDIFKQCRKEQHFPVSHCCNDDAGKLCQSDKLWEGCC